MKLASIASGSSGNCIYVGNEHTGFLVDTGISCKRIVAGLKEIGVDPAGLSGIMITHEHTDHIQGLGVFLRKYKLPVFATAKTIDQILSMPSLGKMDRGLFEVIRPDHPIDQGEIRIEASSVLHDASDPVCYTFRDSHAKVGIATDLGTFDEYLVEKMKGCRSLLVEANHDLHMLMAGPYPYPLKRRIMGNQGHMSNERAGQFLSKVIDDHTEEIFLGHLSKENNYAELAYETVKVELAIHNMDLEQRNLTMLIADRNKPTLPPDKA